MKAHYEHGALKDSLLAKILHLSDEQNKLKAINDKDFSIMVQRSPDQIKELRANYITFKTTELQQIYTQKLYLVLPKPSADELFELAASSFGINQPLVESDLKSAFVINNDKLHTALAYLALKHGDDNAVNNFSQLAVKCKKVFGDNITALEQYIHNHAEAHHDSDSLINAAFSEISIKDDQPALHHTWQTLLANDKERIVGKLIKDADNIDKSAPINLNEALMINATKLFSATFSKIDNLNESGLKNGLNKAKLKMFASEYYKYSLISHIPDDHTNIPLSQAIQKSIEIISSPDIKTKATDKMPELNVPTYNMLMKAEKARILKIIGENESDDLEYKKQSSSEAEIKEAKLSSKKDYYLRKLTPGDLKGFYLGKIIDCCQSMDGSGNDVARHGMSESDSGFYVIQETVGDKIQNYETDRIVGEFWAWLGDDGKSIVFDSFERLGIEHNKLGRIFINAVAVELKKIGYNYIGLGISPSFGSLSLNVEEIESPVKIRKASGYNLETKDFLCQDGETQNDATNLINVVSLTELNQLGLLNTGNDLKNILMHTKELGLKNIILELAGVLVDGNSKLFNILIEETQIDLKSYLLPSALVSEGIESLYQAAALMHPKALNIFLNAGADVNMKDENGHTPMVEAARSKKALEILLEKGIDLKAQSKGGNSLLFAAAKVNYIEIAEKTIKAGVNVNNQFKGETPLILAARYGSTEIVKLLLSVGADKNAQNTIGMTAFDIAVNYGHLETSLLLKSDQERSLTEKAEFNSDFYIPHETLLAGGVEIGDHPE